MVSPGLIPPPSGGPTSTPMVRRIGSGSMRFTFADALSMVEQSILPEDATVERLNGALMYRDPACGTYRLPVIVAAGRSQAFRAGEGERFPVLLADVLP